MTQIIRWPLFLTVNNLVARHGYQTKDSNGPYSLREIWYYMKMETELITIG